MISEKHSFIGVQCPNIHSGSHPSLCYPGGVGVGGGVDAPPTSRFPIPIPGTPGGTGGDCHLWAREAGVDTRESVWRQRGLGTGCS